VLNESPQGNDPDKDKKIVAGILKKGGADALE